MHSSVRRPITWGGARSSVAGSLAVRRVSWSAAVRSPGMITPPMKRASAVTQSKVVAVPKSTTMVSRWKSSTAASTLTMRSAPTLSGSSTSSRTGSGGPRVDGDAGAAGGAGDALHHALGHRRRHRGEADRPDLVGRMAGLDDERAERAAPLVRGAIGIGGQPPVRLQRVGLEQAGGDLGVADVEGEEHGSKLRGVGRLGQLDGARANLGDSSIVTPDAQTPVRADTIGPTLHRAANPPPVEPVAAPRAERARPRRAVCCRRRARGAG